MRCCPRVSEPSTPLSPYLSAVLGTNESNTLEMASAYGTLATGGAHVDPVPVVSVVDAQGETLWQAQPDAQAGARTEVATVADGILQDAVSYGTGRSAIIGRPQIGKTGTADTHTNAWFVGAIPQLTAAVWVGFHEGQIPMEPPRTRITVFGGTWPAQIWRLFMERAAAELARAGLPDARRRLPLGVGRRDAVAALPAERVHAAAEHRHAAVHRGHRADRGLHDTHGSAVRGRAVGDRPRRRRRRRSPSRTQGSTSRFGSSPRPSPPGIVIYQSPSAGTAGDPDEHRHDHRVDRPPEPSTVRVGGPGRPRLTNGSPATKNRHRCSRPTLMPTRDRRRDDASGTRRPRLDPDLGRRAPDRRRRGERSTESACASFPGPSTGRARGRGPRACAMRRARPAARRARRSTALPSPRPRVTTFIIQWLP